MENHRSFQNFDKTLFERVISLFSSKYVDGDIYDTCLFFRQGQPFINVLDFVGFGFMVFNATFRVSTIFQLHLYGQFY